MSLARQEGPLMLRAKRYVQSITLTPSLVGYTVPLKDKLQATPNFMPLQQKVSRQKKTRFDGQVCREMNSVNTWIDGPLFATSHLAVWADGNDSFWARGFPLTPYATCGINARWRCHRSRNSFLWGRYRLGLRFWRLEDVALSFLWNEGYPLLYLFNPLLFPIA